MGPRALPPAERVRRRVAAVAGEIVARQLPTGYQRVGRVLLLRLPETLRPQFSEIGDAWRAELGVGAVLRHSGGVVGEFRIPRLELIAGEDARTEVVEYGIRYRLDAREVLFARGNRTERHRAGTVTRPGEIVADLFAGIGYFALPAALLGRAGEVWAVEKNPVSFHYLLENVRVNHVADRVRALRGDNREVQLPLAAFNRVFLGYLPSSVPWVPRAMALLRSGGGTLHVHLVQDSRDGRAAAETEVHRAVERARGSGIRTTSRTVKTYGPGREHVVVDVETKPQPAGAG